MNQIYEGLNMEIREFEWDDNNIEHIARHGVFFDEVEDVRLTMTLG